MQGHLEWAIPWQPNGNRDARYHDAIVSLSVGQPVVSESLAHNVNRELAQNILAYIIHNYIVQMSLIIVML
jgi:hypothetical protein